MASPCRRRRGRGSLARRGPPPRRTRPFGNVAVPFDQRRDRPRLRDDDLEQVPDRVGDRPVVAVDEQGVAFVVALFGMSGEMDLADRRERKIGQIVERREAVIGRRHEDIVDVEQQAASGAPRDRRG